MISNRKGLLVVGLVAALLASAQYAVSQQQAVEPRGYHPRNVPGDFLPGAFMLEDGKIGPPGEGGYLPTHWTAPGPSVEEAIALAVAALRACEGFEVGAAVVDSGGRARAMLSADGSNGSNIFVAQRKAAATIEFGIPSMEVRPYLEANPEDLSRVTPVMFLNGGAIPLFRNGEMIGAVAVSGAAGGPGGLKDHECATAALDFWKD